MTQRPAGTKRTYFVYLMSSLSRTLYAGVTNNLERRASQHREGGGSGFTARYRVNRLVYFEEFAEIDAAISREKQIKRLLRAKKIALIEATNPDWNDLGSEQ